MGTEDIALALGKQKLFFESGRTLDIDYRLENLKKLRELIVSHEEEICDAMHRDFRKSPFEVLATESRFTVAEINHMIRNLRSWSGRKRVRTSLVNFPARSYIEAQPYGQVLVLSPWNYPFQLAMVPAMSAIAAGNTVIMKVSQKAAATGQVISKILSNFPDELIFYVGGGHDLTDYLLNYHFDYIFFTGSPDVGRKVMRKASEYLTPVTLELGGKNPCVVTADASLGLAAKRIASGKFINAGQTCIAPDYLLVDSRVKDRFLELLSAEITRFYGTDPSSSNDYCRMINSAKTERMESFIKGANLIAGGVSDSDACYVSPTIISVAGHDDPVMQEEIFGPVLPVITYNEFNEIFPLINRHPKSLAAYIFTGSRKLARQFLSGTQSGSAAVNDTIMQVASPHLPFGGVGPSGMGRYHGKKSFETFSNMKSVLEKSVLFDIPLRYPPYTNFKKKMVKLLMR